jgi:hypothetical protein
LTSACSVVVRPSRSLAVILGAGHAIALASASASLGGLPVYLVSTGIILSAAWTVADALQRLSCSVARIDLKEDADGMWLDRAGREHPVRALDATWVSAKLIILGLRASRMRVRWLVLLPDSADADDLRRLRAWLKWRAPTG